MRTTQLRTFSSEQLRRQKAELLGSLPPLDGLLRGSLIERFLRCGKPNCKCAKGRGHGPKRYLSITHPKGRPEMFYVPNAWVEPVQQALADFAALRQVLEQISAVNAELIRRREEL